MTVDLKTIGYVRAAYLGDENGEHTGTKRNPLKICPTTNLGVFGELAISELTPIYQGVFEYTVDNTRLTENTVVSSGTVTQNNGMAEIATTATTGSSAQLQSKAHARYRSGQGGVAKFTAMFSAPVAATEMFIGLADSTGSSEAYNNGMMIGYDGLTFGFHRFQNDALITVAQANWDDPLDGSGLSGMVIDHTKLNVWKIQFQYLGAGAIVLSVEDDATGAFIEVHRVLYANLNTTPHVHNPNFHHMIWVDNKATTGEMKISTASYAFFIEGKHKRSEIHQPIFSTGTIQKTTVTTEVPIVTIRNKTSYASKANFIDTLLQGVGASAEAGSNNNLATLRLLKNATLGGASFADISTTDSIMDFDSAATTVTAGEELMSVDLAGKNDRDFRDLSPFDLILNEGDTLTITASSANSATIRAGIFWKELF